MSAKVFAPKKIRVGEKAKEIIEHIDDQNPVIKQFLEYRKELDDKHDRYEKIVKLSRDATIENKRIIFSLHSLNSDVKDQGIFEETNRRLQVVINKNFKEIALLLNGFDAYQYHRAYTSGLQEFIEAFIFHRYLSQNHIHKWSVINESFNYSLENTTLKLLFTQNDYVLGIADFTGELMRRCINNLGVGNIDDSFKICNAVKEIYTGFLGLPHTSNELNRKLYVLQQSLAKMELVCYTIQIRGSELSKHLLVNVLASNELESENHKFY